MSGISLTKDEAMLLDDIFPKWIINVDPIRFSHPLRYRVRAELGFGALSAATSPVVAQEILAPCVFAFASLRLRLWFAVRLWMVSSFCLVHSFCLEDMERWRSLLKSSMSFWSLYLMALFSSYWQIR